MMKKKFFAIALLALSMVFTPVVGAEDAAVPEEPSTTAPADPSATPRMPEMPEGLNPDAALLARLSGLFNVEDPTSVYDFNIDDNNVEFILDGTWEVRLDSFVHITFVDGTPVMAFTPPVFSQAVDLSSWVLINNTWYFESSFAEEFTKNTVAVGYIGGDDDVIKHVRLGNSGITFPGTYSFVTVGGGTAIAPGAMGTFAGKNWSGDALVRYDAAASRELVLAGMNEVMDEYVPITSFVRGKWFVLPEAPVSGAVDVYVTDEDGSYRDSSSRAPGRRWRKLDRAEYIVHGTDGILELGTETSESVAVVYYGNYASGTSPGTALLGFVTTTWNFFFDLPGDMPAGYLPPPGPGFVANVADRFLATIGGSTALLVRERGHFSPFELGSRYRSDGSEPVLVYPGTGITPDYLDVIDYEGVYAEVSRNDRHAGTGIRDPENRYPLAQDFPFLYLPSGGGQRADTDLAVRSRTWKPITTIALGANAIAGTILVTRNGIADTAFSFDESSGILTLERLPSMNENLRITWLDTDEGARNATLTLAGGIQWNATDALSFFTATAFKWNIAKSGFTDESEQSPGSFVLSTGTKYSGPFVTASTAFAFDVSVPDTTGHYRALGMDSGTDTLYPSDDWYKTTPDEIEPFLGLPQTSVSRTLLLADRVTTSGTDGDKPGTVSDSAMKGSILNLTCSMTSVNSWAGADILTGDKADTDWASASTASISLKNPGSTADFDIYLQLGTGLTDYCEDPETVRTWRLDTPPAGSGWVTRSVVLTDADRTALSAGRNMRLIVIPSATALPPPSTATPLEVSLRSGMIAFTDTGFKSSAEPQFSLGTGKLTVAETNDPAPKTLVNSEADITRRFNSGRTNTVLVTRFTPEADTDAIIVSRHVTALPLASYTELSFFVYAATIPSGPSDSLVRLELTRPESSRAGKKTALVLEVVASSLTAGHWQKITVDLDSRSVSIDESSVSRAKARVVSIDRDVLPTRVAFMLEDWPEPAMPPPAGEYAYTVAFDELYLHESEKIYTIRNKSEFAWKKSGAVLSAGNTAIISDPRIALTADSSARNDGSNSAVSGTADGGLSIFRARADGTITASSGTTRVADSTSHSVTVPVGPVSLKENYNSDFIGNDFKRDNSISLSGPLAAGVSTGVDLQGRNLARNASFSLAPRLPGTGIGTFSLSGKSLFSQTGISPQADITDASWGNLWRDSLRYSLSTGEDDALKRSEKTAAQAAWIAPSGSGITFDADGTSSYTASSSVSIGSTYTYTLAFPLKLGYSTLTPSWKRSASESRAIDAGGSYSSDTEFLSGSFARLSYVFKTAPFADLYADDIAERIADYGTYGREFENRYALAWNRPSMGNTSDLWVPSTIDSSIGRKTVTDATVTNIRDERTATVRLGLSALNVAGAYGSHRIFDWYDQDEISQLYSWNGVWGPSYFTWNVDTWHSIMLFFAGTGTLVTENTFHYDSPDIAGKGKLYRDTIRIVWKRPGKDSFLTAIAMRWTKFPLTTTREESFSCTITRSETNSSAYSYDHTLKTGIGANGEVSVTGGSSYANTADGLTTIELRMGVGGKVSY